MCYVLKEKKRAFKRVGCLLGTIGNQALRAKALQVI